MSPSSAREEILRRLRQHRRTSALPPSEAVPSDYAELETGIPADPLAHFTAVFEENHGVVRHFANYEAVVRAWPSLQKELEPPFYAGPLPFRLPDVRPLPDEGDLSEVGTAFTGCAALVAQTGSVAITAAADPWRALSVYAPVHVVIAFARQVVPTLQAAFEQLAADRSSFVTLIGGPSRTADIEKTLVLGAHGPRRVEVWLMMQG